MRSSASHTASSRAWLYVVGDVLSGVVYNVDRPYSFVNQWISELTAYGSPVRPLMVSVIIAHDVLIAFGLGIWKAADRSRAHAGQASS